MVLTLLTAAVAQAAPDMPREPPLRDLSVRHTIHIESFGASPDDGLDDLPALRQALARAAASPVPTEVAFERGTYHLDSAGKHHSLLSLTNARDIVIDGHGAQIVVRNPRAGLLRIGSCQRVIVRDLTIDWDPIPFTQGVVTRVHQQAGAVEVQLDAGVPSLGEGYFREASITWALLKDKSVPGRPKAGAPNCVPIKRWRRLGDRQFRVDVSGRAKHFEAGDRYVQLARAGGAVGFVYRSSDVTFSNVTIHTSPGANYVGLESSRINLLGCRTVLKPGRWHTTCADGVLLSRCRVGPWIEGCTFDALGDDAMNFNTKGMHIKSREGEGALTLVGRRDHLDRAPTPLVEAGDRLRVFDPKAGRLLGDARAATVEAGEGVVRVVLDKPLPAVEPGTRRGSPIVFNDDTVCAGFVVRGNVFRHIRRYGFLCQARDGLVEGNTFEATTANAIVLLNALHSNTGFASRSIVIRGNTFRDCYLQEPTTRIAEHAGVVSLLVERLGYRMAAWQGIENVTIEGNTFLSWRGISAVHVACARGVTVQGNTFRSGQPGQAVVRVRHARGVQVIENEIAGAGPDREQVIEVDELSTERVECRGNKLVED